MILFFLMRMMLAFALMMTGKMVNAENDGKYDYYIADDAVDDDDGGDDGDHVGDVIRMQTAPLYNGCACYDHIVVHLHPSLCTQTHSRNYHQRGEIRRPQHRLAGRWRLSTTICLLPTTICLLSTTIYLLSTTICLRRLPHAIVRLILMKKVTFTYS